MDNSKCGANFVKDNSEHCTNFIKTIKNRKSFNYDSILRGFAHHSCPGFERGTVTMIATPAGGGKTAFVVSALNYILTEGKYGPAVVIPDHNINYFIERLVAAKGGLRYPVTGDTWQTKEEWEKVVVTTRQIATSGFCLSSRKFLSTDDIFDDIENMKIGLEMKDKTLDILFIDSLNSIQEKWGPQFGVNDSLEQLKFIAEHWNVAVVVTYTIPLSRIPENQVVELRNLRALGIDDENLNTILCLRIAEAQRRSFGERDVQLCAAWPKLDNHSQYPGLKFNEITCAFSHTAPMELPNTTRPDSPSDTELRLKEDAAKRKSKRCRKKSNSQY